MQELHLVSVHVMCEYIDLELPRVVAEAVPFQPVRELNGVGV